MAKPVRQLKELLQEKQEPFILEICLVEKGYLKNRFNQETISCHGNSRKSPNGLKRSKKGILQCPKVLRAVYNQVISVDGRLRVKSSNSRRGNVDVIENKERNGQEISELETFSSASSSTVFDSCTVSDTEETSNRDKRLQWQFIEESRLEERVSHRDSLLLNNGTKNLRGIKEKGSHTCAFFKNKVSEDSILSASLWKILVQSATEKPKIPGVPEIQELAQSNRPWRYLKSRKVLQQTKQLLFDCVREIVETQERKEKQKQQHRDLGRLIEEKIRCWGNQYGEESNLAQLLELDYQDSAQEWIDYKPHRKRIASEMGDAIMEELRNEIVMDMI